MITKQDTIQLAANALQEGLILTAKMYVGGGVITAGPFTPAVGYRGRFAAYAYGPIHRTQEATYENYDARDVALHLVENCGRGNVRKAVESARERHG